MVDDFVTARLDSSLLCRNSGQSNDCDRADEKSLRKLLLHDHVDDGRLPCLTLGLSNSALFSPIVRAEAAESGLVRKSLTRATNLEDRGYGIPRKKLRLSKQQTLVLEEYFKGNNTLNNKQKQDLGKKLNLRPRQVEVWFQNRRARTKLKQAEVECELLRKCYGTLKEENTRLEKELQMLKSTMTTPTPSSMSICPSCEISL